MSNSKVAVPILIAAAGLIAIPAEKLPTSELSGAEMYRIHCATCHGTDGKGAGPAAPALKKAAPDLTLISWRNKGQFPDFRITHIIDGYEIQAYHGSREMPIWGDYFRDMQRDEMTLKLREHYLTEYLRSMQQK
jgi:mono/diheme cytochrome c family protein